MPVICVAMPWSDPAGVNTQKIISLQRVWSSLDVLWNDLCTENEFVPCVVRIWMRCHAGTHSSCTRAGMIVRILGNALLAMAAKMVTRAVGRTRDYVYRLCPLLLWARTLSKRNTMYSPGAPPCASCEHSAFSRISSCLFYKCLVFIPQLKIWVPTTSSQIFWELEFCSSAKYINTGNLRECSVISACYVTLRPLWMAYHKAAKL